MFDKELSLGPYPGNAYAFIDTFSPYPHAPAHFGIELFSLFDGQRE